MIDPAPVVRDPGSLLTRLIGLHGSLTRVLMRTGAPLVALGTRLLIAQAYFVSGLLKVTHWQTALDLATHEYPVRWLSPVAAAYLDAGIEVGGSVLLAVGLCTRPAAVALLALAAVAQSSYQAFDVQLFSIALLGALVVWGAGAWSIDHLLGGLLDSAIPLAGPVCRFYSSLSRILGPLLLLGLRVWIATALMAGSLSAGRELASAHALSLWLPWRSVPVEGPITALLIAVPFSAGAGTRYLAALLWVLAGAEVMADMALANQSYWLALLLLPFTRGAGAWSVDAALVSSLGRRFPALQGRTVYPLEGLPRIVIVGAGFGGLACATRLAGARASVTLIDRCNHHLFQPLLYQVATASLSPGDIAAPIRPLVRDAFNTRVILGSVTGVDTASRMVLVEGKHVPYDYLVLASGATHGYFGRDDWQHHAPGLKRIEDATEIRRRLLIAFERAEAADDAAEREALLTFLVVGGGPTGVELAGAIAELARFGMEKDFRRFDPAGARVILVQSAPRILPTFPDSLSCQARKSLERLGVEVRVGSRVEHIDAQGVRVSGQCIASRTVFWAAGVVASPAARWLGIEADSAGRVPVGPELTVPGLSEVYAIGDTAVSKGWNGQPVPGLAPAAKQQGEYVARHLRWRIEGRRAPAQFRYRHLGSLATIGRKSAVADFGRLKLWGAPAWWLWGVIHVGFLTGVRNRIATVINWFWAYVTFRGAIRLITGAAPGRESACDRAVRATNTTEVEVTGP